MLRKIKIGMVVNFLPDKRNHGGVSYQVHLLAQELSEKYEITIFSINEVLLKHNYENKSIPFSKFLAKRPYLSIIFYPFLVLLQNFNKFDILHTHGDDYLFFFLKKPIIRTFYGSALGEFKTASSIKRKLHQCFRYITEYLSGFHANINLSISQSTKKYLPFIKKVIPCGIDLNKFKPGKEKSKHPSILFVGTIRGRKRGWFLVKLFNEEIKVKIPDAELWIVSSEKVGGNGIKWFGHIPEQKLIELYQRAWIFCLPSRYEGFGVPYIEAMACGTPVVSTLNQGAIEVLQSGEFGFIVNDKNLPYTLIELIKDHDKRNRIRNKCLEYVKKYSITKVAKKYEQIYYRMVSEKAL